MVLQGRGLSFFQRISARQSSVLKRHLDVPGRPQLKEGAGRLRGHDRVGYAPRPVCLKLDVFRRIANGYALV